MPKTTVATKQSASAIGANSKVGGKRSGHPSASDNKMNGNGSSKKNKKDLSKQPSKQPPKSKSTSKQPSKPSQNNEKPTAKKQRALVSIDHNSSLNQPVLPAPAEANALQETTLPLSLEMSSAMKAVDSETLGVALAPIVYLNLVYNKWLYFKLFGGGQMRAMTLFLTNRVGGELQNVVRCLRRGGTVIWKVMFLAEYPRFDGVRLLTANVEDSDDNGLLFKVDGGWAATVKLLGYDPSNISDDGSFKRLFGGWVEHYEHRIITAKFGGQVVLKHKHCRISCDLCLFKTGKMQTAASAAGHYSTMPRPSPTQTTVATVFILPVSFAKLSGDKPTHAEVKTVVSHMLTLNGDQLKILMANVNSEKLKSLLCCLGRTGGRGSKKSEMIKWVVENTSIWHVVANKIANEVDIGGLNEFVAPFGSNSKPYTVPELTRISRLLESMGRTSHGRVQIETYMGKVMGTRLKEIKNHNGIGTQGFIGSKEEYARSIKSHFFR